MSSPINISRIWNPAGMKANERRIHMNISPLIYDFRDLLPSYHLPQEYAFHWLAAAHAQAEVRALGRMDLQSEWLDRMGRLLRGDGWLARTHRRTRPGVG